MKEYDLIIMNLPFSTGSSHLQKALDCRHYIGIELNGEYCVLAEEQIQKVRREISNE